MAEKKIEVIPYLTFGGDCEAAIHAYLAAFGGEIHYLSRWTAETAGSCPQQVGKVMHAEFTLGQTRMSGGDASGMPVIGDAVKLMIHMDDMEDATRAVSILSEGGMVLSPLKPHPAPDDGGCGSLTRDRFGYTWIVTCPNPDKR